MNTADVRRILTNPFYCLKRVDPIFAVEHRPIVTEEVWIRTAVKFIKDEGAEAFIKELLENLKGNYVPSEDVINPPID